MVLTRRAPSEASMPSTPSASTPSTPSLAPVGADGSVPKKMSREMQKLLIDANPALGGHGSRKRKRGQTDAVLLPQISIMPPTPPKSQSEASALNSPDDLNLHDLKETAPDSLPSPPLHTVSCASHSAPVAFDNPFDGWTARHDKAASPRSQAAQRPSASSSPRTQHARHDDDTMSPRTATTIARSAQHKSPRSSPTPTPSSPADRVLATRKQSPVVHSVKRRIEDYFGSAGIAGTADTAGTAGKTLKTSSLDIEQEEETPEEREEGHVTESAAATAEAVQVAEDEHMVDVDDTAGHVLEATDATAGEMLEDVPDLMTLDDPLLDADPDTILETGPDASPDAVLDTMLEAAAEATLSLALETPAQAARKKKVSREMRKLQINANPSLAINAATDLPAKRIRRKIKPASSSSSASARARFSTPVLSLPPGPPPGWLVDRFLADVAEITEEWDTVRALMGTAEAAIGDMRRETWDEKQLRVQREMAVVHTWQLVKAPVGREKEREKIGGKGKERAV